MFLAFAVAAGWIGLASDTLWLAFAGLPASGTLTTIFGSDLFLAWPLDAVVWITLGVLVGRRAMTPSEAWRPTALVVGAALVLGLVLGSLVVPA